VPEGALVLAGEIANAPHAAVIQLKQTLARPRREALERALAAEHADHVRIFSDPRTAHEIASRYPSRVGEADAGGGSAP
jgi:hypothetical protein